MSLSSLASRASFVSRASLITFIAIASGAASVGCAPTQFPRESHVSNARNGDPWLVGPECPEDVVDRAALHAEDVEPGAGIDVGRGETVRVHYLVKLPNGAKVRDSRDTGLPIELVIGSGKTFCGFDRAMVGMKAGGQRKVTIPARLAFGDGGRAPDVPPATDLTVVIDLYLPADNALQPHSGPVNGGGGRRR